MFIRLLTCAGLAVVLVSMTILSPTIQAQAQTCEYWAAPALAGSDSNPGTFALPWATLQHASEAVPDNSCTVWFKDGVYTAQNHVKTRFTTPTVFKAIHPYHAILQYNGRALKISGARNIVVEGFEIRHTGVVTEPLLVEIRRRSVAGVSAEFITLRNNIIHDSYNNDLLKIYDGARFIRVENNVFYNQGPSEEHMDVNGVADVTIQDNIYFNDFAGSGRINPGNTKSFIVIKDSLENPDGLVGSERVTVRRNIFLNWEGGLETFVQIGADGKPYYEARDVRVENNLVIGNAHNSIYATFGVRGAKNITFTNNTIVGDLPSSGYAFWVGIKELNPLNENIYFYNNIWSDPTGTMGAKLSGGDNNFSNGDLAQTNNLVLDNNLYWNGGAVIPPGDLVSPLVNDTHRVVANPLLNINQTALVLPRWNGSSFLSGSASIRQEFLRLVERYGKISLNSPAVGRANPAFIPADDILGQPRIAPSSLGAYRQGIVLTGRSGLTTIWLNWSDARAPGATSLAIAYSKGATSQLITDIPTTTQVYTLTGLLPYSLYTLILTARGGNNAVLGASNSLLLLTTDRHVYLPIVVRDTW